MTTTNPMFPPEQDNEAKIAKLEADHDRAWREGRYSDCATIMMDLIRLKGGRHPADKSPKNYGIHGFTTW